MLVQRRTFEILRLNVVVRSNITRDESVKDYQIALDSNTFSLNILKTGFDKIPGQTVAVLQFLKLHCPIPPLAKPPNFAYKKCHNADNNLDFEHVEEKKTGKSLK